MYFHAYISTEKNATAKYQDSLVTDRHGHQVYYINCTSGHNYPLFVGTTANSYGKELDQYVESVFAKFNFGGLYHDEAATTKTSYTFAAWDGYTALLDPQTKAVVATPGSLPLLRLTSKLKLLRTVVNHSGHLLMNGPPVTRTFREAALRAGSPTVMAEVETEQENADLHTHLFTPIALTRAVGYTNDLDVRFNHTCGACKIRNTDTAKCLGHSIRDKLSYGVLPYVYESMFLRDCSEPITDRLFPIAVKGIQSGAVVGAKSLVTTRSSTSSPPTARAQPCLATS